jgi:hypothetical protein
VELLSWFGATHELALTGFGASWRLAWLPGPGSVGEQDARLLEGLTLARAVMQATLAEEMQAQRGNQGLTAWRERVRRDRG